MRKLLFVFMSLCALLLLVGCAGEVSQIELEPTLPLATLSSTQAIVLQSPTETVSATATSTVESEPIYTATLEPPATTIYTATPTMPVLFQPNATISPLVCNQVKSYINIQQETNNESWQLMDFVFEKENALTFLVWSNRLDPSPPPISQTGPPELSQSSQILLKRYIWDFNSGDLIEGPVTEQSAIQNPCDQNCPMEVIDVAPDNDWQLLQITEAPADYQGIWLANNEIVKNLVPYVPIFSQWQWSNDRRMLWLIYTLQDISGESYGSESMVVDLSASVSPQVVFQSWDTSQSQPSNLLSPDEYNLVFSPEKKTVLSYEFIGSSKPNLLNNQLEVYHIDISQNPPQLLNTYKARYPFLIDWSDTLQDFLVLELNTTGAVIYTLDHEVIYEIPMEVIKQMPSVLGMDGQIRTDFSTEVNIMSLNVNLERVAISSALDHVVLMSRNRAWSFSCEE